MHDLQNLLDQIDRLDQETTKGPWYQGQEKMNESPVDVFATRDPEDPYAQDIATYMHSAKDAEFIVLARTALPQLSAVIRRLRECAQTLTEDNNDASDYASGIHEAVECFEHIITDALGADND